MTVWLLRKCGPALDFHRAMEQFVSWISPRAVLEHHTYRQALRIKWEEEERKRNYDAGK